MEQVEEVFNAVTDPNITVTFETASTALNVVDNLTHQSSGQLNKEDIDNIKGTLSAVSSQAASTKETAQVCSVNIYNSSSIWHLFATDMNFRKELRCIDEVYLVTKTMKRLSYFSVISQTWYISL